MIKPFFILGCPRSGTTIIRNYIKANFNLISPEETFYYRWTFPFGSREFYNRINTELSKFHRSIDGISESDFQELYAKCSNRKELLEGHLSLMDNITKCDGWFEKTPQNIYASLLLTQDFPDSTLLFVCRNPINACASLFSGRQIKTSSLTEAICYWKESYQIYHSLNVHGYNIELVKYEDFTACPQDFSERLSKLFNISKSPNPHNIKVNAANDRHLDVFSNAQLQAVTEACKKEMIELGYYNPT